MPATTERYWLPVDPDQFPEGDGCKYECIDVERYFAEVWGDETLEA